MRSMTDGPTPRSAAAGAWAAARRSAESEPRRRTMVRVNRWVLCIGLLRSRVAVPGLASRGPRKMIPVWGRKLNGFAGGRDKDADAKLKIGAGKSRRRNGLKG